MPAEIESEIILRCASTILHRFWQGAFQLEPPILVSDRDRNQVLRCHVHSEEIFPRSVIVKVIKDPLDTARGMTDWASLSFLSQIMHANSVAPGFLGGDREHQLFVMEDLGAGGSIEDIMLTHDTLRAMTMLRALARQMGLLHAATTGKEKLFQRLCEDLSLAAVPARFQEAERWLAGCQKVKDWCRELGYTPPSGFDQVCMQIAHFYAHPGDLLAFTHGDPAPTNNYLKGNEIYLVDFEYAGFRHLLYDLTGWNILCPLPKACVRQMRNELLVALASTFPALTDSQMYQSSWAMLCTYRALALLSWMPLHLIRQNEPWVGDWSKREAMMSALYRWEEATRGVKDLEVMSRMSSQLLKRSRALWPDIPIECIPQWPAFT